MNDINTWLTNTGISNEASYLTCRGGTHEGVLHLQYRLIEFANPKKHIKEMQEVKPTDHSSVDQIKK